MAKKDKKIFTINGRIINHATQQGIPGLRIEAWDKDLIFDDFVGSALTDKNGAFTIRFDRSRFKELFLDRRPDLYFKVFHKDKQIASTEDSVLWNVQKGDTEIIIELDVSEDWGIPAKAFLVSGHATQPDGDKEADMVVKAFNKRLRTEDLLGEKVTDNDGYYKIEYYPPSSLTTEQEGIDLIVRAFDQAGQEIAASPIIFNAGEEEKVNLVIGGKEYIGPSEYKKFLSTIEPLLQGIAIINLSEEEVSYVSGKTGISREYIDFLVEAAKLSLKTGLPPEVFYAFFRQDLPTSLSGLLDQNIQLLRMALETAVHRNIIGLKHGELIDTYIKRIEELIIEKSFVEPEGAGRTSLGVLLKTTSLPENLQKKVVELYIHHQGSMEDFLSTLSEHPDLKEGNVAEEVQFVLTVGSLTQNHLPLIRELGLMKEQGEIEQGKDLVQMEIEDWLGLINKNVNGLIIGTPNTIMGDTEEEKAQNYAESIMLSIEAAFPTATVAHKLEKDDRQIPFKNELVHFFKQNPNFDFSFTYIEGYLEKNTWALDGIGPKDPVVKDLKAMQRICCVTPPQNKYETMYALWNDGIDSAQCIFNLGKEAFIQGYENIFGGKQEAETVFYKASHIMALSLNIAAIYGIHFNPIESYAIPSIPQEVKGIPDWRTLFGSADFCECKHCRSLYSPAAYLVDILAFLKDIPSKDSRSALDVLFDRRGDIGNLELSCKNTHTLLPYIDLVNEILENAVALPGDKLIHKATHWSEEELKTNPEYINRPVYDDLARKPVYPWNLPFDLWTEEARVYLEHLGVPLYQLMKTFPKNGSLTETEPKDIEIACEYLGLTDLDRKIITGETITGKKPWDYWGMNEYVEYPADSDNVINWVEALKHVPLFLKKSGLTYKDLLELLMTKFINPAKYIFPSGQSDCDLEKISLENLTEESLDRIHRFVRLWKKLDWRISDLDKTIIAMKAEDLSEGFLIELSHIKQLLSELNVPLVTMLSWWDVIDTNSNNGDDNSLYEQLFLNKSLIRPEDESFPEDKIFTLNNEKTELKDSDECLTQHIPDISAALGISASDLSLILKNEIDSLQHGCGANLEDEVKLNLANLSHLYRIVTFAQALQVSISEFFSLKALIGTNRSFMSSTEEVIRFIEKVAKVQSSGFSIPELDYLLRHRHKDSEGIAPTDEYIILLLDEICAKLHDIELEHTFTSDPTGKRTEEKLRVLLENDEVETALAIIKGTFLFSIDKELIDDEFWKDLDDNRLSEDLREIFKTHDIELSQDAVVSTEEPEKRWQITDNERIYNIRKEEDGLPSIYTATPAEWGAFIDKYLDNFLNTQEAKEQLINPATCTIKKEERGNYILENLLSYLERIASENFIKAKLANELSIKISLMEKLLTVGQVGSTNILDDFLVLKTVDSDSDDEEKKALYDKAKERFILLHKISMVISAFNFSSEDLVQYIFDNAEEIGWLDLFSLPITESEYNSEMFTSWARLLDLSKLGNSFPLGEESLSELYNNSSEITDIHQFLSEKIGWDLNDLKYLCGEKGFNYRIPDDFEDEKALMKLKSCFDLIARIGMSACKIQSLIPPYSSPSDSFSAARDIIKAAKSKYDIAQWNEIAKPLRDVLRERQRSSLVSYAMSKFGYESPSNLFGHFLIDVEMSPCQMTSRIKQAISSVQLFVQRCLLNLEPNVTLNAEQAEQWQWMKNYRVWEANRKIFLYPENWIEPELRDDKSPFFKELEDELMQNEVTSENVEKALLNYLEKLDEVVRLKISGMYEEKEAGRYILHVFGRTKSDPRIYYYRQWIDKSYWTPWEKVNVDIGGDCNHLIPVVYNRRLYLFWPIFRKIADEVIPAEGVLPTKYWEIKMAWSEFKNKKWTPKKIIEEMVKCRTNWHTERLFKPTTNNIIFSTSVADMTGDLIIKCRTSPTDKWRGSFYGYNLIKKDGSFQVNEITADKPYCSEYTQYEYMNLVKEPAYNEDIDMLWLPVSKPPFPALGPIIKTIYYRIVFPHQRFVRSFFDFIFKSPFFYQDETRTFFVRPLEEFRLIFYEFETFYHPYVDEFIRVLNRFGIDGLFASDLNSETRKLHRQLILKYFFHDIYLPHTNLTKEPYPIDNIDFSYKGAYSSYNWELFFHIPLMIADRLSKNQHFKEAQKWFHYVFDPTDCSPPPIYIYLLCPVTSIPPDSISAADGWIKTEMTVKTDYLEDYNVNRLGVIMKNFESGDEIILGGLKSGGGVGIANYTILVKNADIKDISRLGYEDGPQVVPNAQVGDTYYSDEDYIVKDLPEELVGATWIKTFNADKDNNDPNFLKFVVESQLPVPEHFWQVRPFFTTKPKLIHDLMKLINEGDDAMDEQIEKWEENPFMPHLIARLRPCAYMRTVVMKYIDNLIAWGDYLFRQDTIESINEATQLYILAAEILGKRPETIPSNIEQDVFSFNDLLNYGLDRFSNALITGIENMLAAHLGQVELIAEKAGGKYEKFQSNPK